jgi:epoxyqueuosine reductase QueG
MMSFREWASKLEQFLEPRAAFVGFADLESLLSERFTGLSRGISIAVRLSDPIIDELISGPTKLYAYHYHAMNRYLDHLAIEAMHLLRPSGYRFLPIPSSQVVDRKRHAGHISHKMLATRAGLGWIGKSALLVTPEAGPRIRFVSILTDAPLPVGQPIEESQCEDCQACVKACPVGAIKGVNWSVNVNRSMLLDADRCAAFTRKNNEKYGAHVCGVCVCACPEGISKA